MDARRVRRSFLWLGALVACLAFGLVFEDNWTILIVIMAVLLVLAVVERLRESVVDDELDHRT